MRTEPCNPRDRAPDATGAWLTPREALARHPGDRPAASSRMVDAPARYGFRAGSIGLIIDATHSGEVLEDTPIYPIPNTDAWLRGLINVRGNLVAVFDLERLFDQEPPGGEPQWLLLVGTGADAAAFPITGLPESLRLGASLPQPPAVHGQLDDHVRAAYLVEGALWLDIDLDAFLISLAESRPT